MARAEDPPADDRRGQFEVHLASLRARFLTRVRQDATELATLSGLLSCGLQEDPLRRIHALAHALHGTAAAFGQEQVGQIAAQLESAAELVLAEKNDQARATRIRAVQNTSQCLRDWVSENLD
ncbi:Hpt domain-containing protein [Roseomonas sp. GCM10028921]